MATSFSDLPVGKTAIADSSGAEYNSGNPLPTTATITGDVNIDSTAIDSSSLIGKPSGGDFTTAYASATTITLGVYPGGTSVNAHDIISVQQISTAGAVTNIYSRDDATMSVAANVLTVTGATFAATDTFIVYTNVGRTAMQAQGTEDTAGADTYTTILTTGSIAHHALISLDGTNDAIISFNGGTTDHFVMKANSVIALDDLYIAASIAIQGKNKTGGSNYTNLNVSVW